MDEVLPRSSWSQNHVSRCYPASSLIRAHASVLNPPLAYGLPLVNGSVPVAVSPDWEEDLPDVLSAYLSLRAWTPTPAARVGHVPVSSHTTAAFPPFGPGRRSTMFRTATSVRRVFRGCSHSRMFRPTGLLTTPVAPTDTACAVWQPWFLRPSISWFVTSPRPRYASRPNRAIDGRGLSPHQIRSLVGCSPNAEHEPLPEAGAQRTMEAVGSMPWFGSMSFGNHSFVYLQSLYSSIDFRGFLQLSS